MHPNLIVRRRSVLASSAACLGWGLAPAARGAQPSHAIVPDRAARAPTGRWATVPRPPKPPTLVAEQGGDPRNGPVGPPHSRAEQARFDPPPVTGQAL